MLPEKSCMLSQGRDLHGDEEGDDELGWPDTWCHAHRPAFRVKVRNPDGNNGGAGCLKGAI